MSEDRELTEAVHAWLRDDTSLAVKMNITPEAVAKLVERLARPPAIGVEAVAWAEGAELDARRSDYDQGWRDCEAARALAAPSTIQTGVEGFALASPLDRDKATSILIEALDNAYNAGSEYAQNHDSRDVAKSILAALPSVPVGGLGASAAPIPTEIEDGAVLVWPWAGDDPRWDAVDTAWRRHGEEVCDDDGKVDFTELSIIVGIAVHEAFRQAAISDDTQPGTSAASEPSLPTEDAAGGAS